MERLTRFRAGVLLGIFSFIMLLYAARLFDLQIIKTDGNTDNTTLYSTVTTVRASRGSILDRNGKILVGNRASYDLVFNHFVIPVPAAEKVRGAGGGSPGSPAGYRETSL